MQSEHNIVIAEEVYEAVRERTSVLREANGTTTSMSASEPPPQALVPDDDPSNRYMLSEQRVTDHDAMHSLPQGDATVNPKRWANTFDSFPIPKLSDPLKTQIPKPNGDPFEYFFKPMLEKDTVQCSAWKDEVQNILIFAGLFSAVVTAFIVGSYQRLQPDPNDAIVGLLAHIATRLDNVSVNGNAPSPSVNSIISDANFSPSRADININIFWFISLILSLTAALIGIITLQWLREHQRYDNTLEPQQRMVILKARLDSFKQWYVPQIFAALPLLLQGALVLFFAGLIEFLFSLRLEVAVPVTLSISIPLIFLVATTLLPVLQVCILQDPFRLSINNNVPSPCPYKSPQSLIFRRIGIHSNIGSKVLASIVADAYACIIQIGYLIRRLAGLQLPVFNSQDTHLRARLRDPYPRKIRNIADTSGDWTSIDRSWLDVRTTYAVSLQMAYRDSSDINLAMPRNAGIASSLTPEVYDSTCCFREILASDRARLDKNALYHCVETLCSQVMDSFKYSWRHNADSLLHIIDLYVAFGRLLCYDRSDRAQLPITAAFIEDVILQQYSKAYGSPIVVRTLHTAFIAYWVDNFYHSVGPPIQVMGKEVAGRLLINRLDFSPERLFATSSSNMWLPQHFRFLRENHSQSVTHLFLAFLKSCSVMQVKLHQILCPPSSRTTYWRISAYMEVVVSNQHRDDISETLTYLTQLCKAPSMDLIQERPFLMIAACYYLDATVRKRHVFSPTNLLFPNLVNILLKACRGVKIAGDLSFVKGWAGLDSAINAIYNHHNHSGTKEFCLLP